MGAEARRPSGEELDRGRLQGKAGAGAPPSKKRKKEKKIYQFSDDAHLRYWHGALVDILRPHHIFISMA